MKISELMQPAVVTVTPDTSLKDVAALLVERRISGVPVCLADGRVCGVVSEADILLKEQGVPLEAAGLLSRILDEAYGDVQRFEARTAGDAMTAPVFTVSPKDDVSEAARLMTTKHVNRLPVVEGSRLVGIVTRADLVRAFQRDDEAIRREIVDDVLVKSLWIAASELEVSVVDGVVSLAGTVETRTIAEIVVVYVRRVPGVVALESSLAWRIDDTVSRRRRTQSGRVAQPS